MFAPVYLPSHGGGPAGPLLTPESLKNAAHLVVGLLTVSAIARFAFQRRRVDRVLRLANLVAEHRASFVPLAIEPREPGDTRVHFARWDDAANVYRVVSGVRATGADDEHVELPAGLPIEWDPRIMLPIDKSGTRLDLLLGDGLWILARTSTTEEVTGLRDGARRRTSFEPILDRFVIVPGLGQPQGPFADPPSWVPMMVHPMLTGFVVNVAASGALSRAIAEVVLILFTMFAAVFELAIWSVLLYDRRYR